MDTRLPPYDERWLAVTRCLAGEHPFSHGAGRLLGAIPPQLKPSATCG